MSASLRQIQRKFKFAALGCFTYKQTLLVLLKDLLALVRRRVTSKELYQSSCVSLRSFSFLLLVALLNVCSFFCPGPLTLELTLTIPLEKARVVSPIQQQPSSVNIPSACSGSFFASLDPMDITTGRQSMQPAQHLLLDLVAFRCQ